MADTRADPGTRRRDISATRADPADGLGALLQLGALDMLEKLGCKPA